MLETDRPVELLYILGAFALAYVVAGIENPVDTLHGGKPLGDVVCGLGKVLDGLYDAVQYHHVEDEGRSVDEGLVLDDEETAEAEHYGYHGGSQELAHGVGQGLARGDAGILGAHGTGNLVETGGHGLLGKEGLYYAESAQSLFHHAHSVAPQGLGLGRTLLEVTPYDSHQPHHQRCEHQHEEGEFPGDEDEGPYVENDEDRILQDHVQRTGDGVLDLLHVAAHAGDDIPFALLGEEPEGKGEYLVVDLQAHVLHYARAHWHHHRGGAEVAGSLEGRHQDKYPGKNEKGYHGAVMAQVTGYEPVEIVDEYLFEIAASPGNEVVGVLFHLEDDLQHGDDEGEGKNIEYGTEDVHQHRTSQVFLVRAYIAPYHRPESFHDTKIIKITI